jgi:lysosomal Pro-X carboxypeptidase
MNIINNIAGATGNMAMVNYPYPTSFLSPLPGNPVKEACNKATKDPFASDEVQAAGLSEVSKLYFNFDGKKDCLNLTLASGPAASSNDLDAFGWDYQVCNEMVMPIAQSGISDMYLP